MFVRPWRPNDGFGAQAAGDHAPGVDGDVVLQDLRCAGNREAEYCLSIECGTSGNNLAGDRRNLMYAVAKLTATVHKSETQEAERLVRAPATEYVVERRRPGTVDQRNRGVDVLGRSCPERNRLVSYEHLFLRAMQPRASPD